MYIYISVNADGLCPRGGAVLICLGVRKRERIKNKIKWWYDDDEWILKRKLRKKKNNKNEHVKCVVRVKIECNNNQELKGKEIIRGRRGVYGYYNEIRKCKNGILNEYVGSWVSVKKTIRDFFLYVD